MRLCVVASLALARAHVPTYETNDDGGNGVTCAHLPHDHTTSQVVYLRGSGGVELDADEIDADTIDFDVVFRDEPSPETYSLYVGCGGCAADDALLNASRVVVTGYETPVLEPFTQTAYRSAFEKDNRKFNASALQSDVCPQGHFTIRLVQHEGDEIVWGAVVGLAERFTYVELMLFSFFILRNHGQTWNELPWTKYVSLAAGIGLYVLGWLISRRVQKWWKARKARLNANKSQEQADDSSKKQEPKPECVEWFLYGVAIVAFCATFVEVTIHACYAQQNIPLRSQFFIAVFGVGVFANAIGLLCVVVSKSVRLSPTLALIFCVVGVAVAAHLPILAGAGLYLGPGALVLALLVRAVRIAVDTCCPGRLELPRVNGSTGASASRRGFANVQYRPLPQLPALRGDGRRAVV